ncbi:hypothetical protein F5878DRAFT_444207 [Lentinula raphanica]|uniref:Uncharacterized protein n=1 Tax=Lentinula raphanica TaxID=153919 RepID=A0AA38U5U6_9AGAR|nr:hypothetical protein F5878DRAFT_444207 [Lentinula raphanica]
MKNPEQAAAPFNITYKTTKKMWEWTEEPGNEYSSHRFTAAMKNTAEASYPPELLTSSMYPELSSTCLWIDSTVLALCRH